MYYMLRGMYKSVILVLEIIIIANLCFMKDIINFKAFKDFIGELTVTYRRTKLPTTTITSSFSVYELVKEIYDECMDDHEEFKVLHLNNSNGVINIHHATKGTDTACVVSVKDIMRNAILTSSKSLILIHNHPSGGLKPSQADRNLTEKVKKACAVMDLNLFDHIIVTRESYYSFADEGDL